MKFITVQFYRVYSCFLHVKLKYLPHFLIFERPQPTFLPEYERPVFISTQNDRRNNFFVDFNFAINLYQM